jgi:hypothetical protein
MIETSMTCRPWRLPLGEGAEQDELSARRLVMVNGIVKYLPRMTDTWTQAVRKLAKMSNPSNQ